MKNILLIAVCLSALLVAATPLPQGMWRASSPPPADNTTQEVLRATRERDKLLYKMACQKLSEAEGLFWRSALQIRGIMQRDLTKERIHNSEYFAKQAQEKHAEAMEILSHMSL